MAIERVQEVKVGLEVEEYTHDLLRYTLALYLEFFLLVSSPYNLEFKELKAKLRGSRCKV